MKDAASDAQSDAELILFLFFGWFVFESLRFSGSDEVTVLEVSWPDGSVLTRTLRPGEMNTVVEVLHPSGAELTPLANDTQVLGQQTVEAKQLSQNFVFMDNTEIKLVCVQVGSRKFFSVLLIFFG